MFAMFNRPMAQSKTTLPDFAGAAHYLMRWLTTRARRGAAQSLCLLESVPLTAHASVALVRFEGETLVLGVTAQSVTVIAKGAAPESPANAAHLNPPGRG